MKWLIIAVLALLLSVSVALVALPDPGYVLIGYGKYSIEMSLLVLLLVLGAAYLGLRALAGVWHVPRRMRRWSYRRRMQRLRVLHDTAILQLGEGHIERGERSLGRLTGFRDAPLDAYFAAARAANRLGADQRRDQYLQLALQRNPNAATVVALTRAELQIAAHQLEQAQTTLDELQTDADGNPQQLRLRMQLHLQQDDWRKLLELLPQLRHSDVLDQEQWQKLAVRVYRQQLNEDAHNGAVSQLIDDWENIPASIQRDQELCAVYARDLIRLGAHTQAEEVLREHLRHSWSMQLVYLYGNLGGADTQEQQRTAERWLEKHPEDPALLLTLGKISLRNKLWGKARGYLEASLSGNPTPEAYHLLGGLLDQLEESDKAAECYRKGIELTVTASDRALPAPPKEPSGEDAGAAAGGQA